MLDPGPDFAKTPAQTVEVLRALAGAARRSADRCCWRSRGKDFIGAHHAAGRRARGWPGRSPRSAHGVRCGRPRAPRPRRRRRRPTSSRCAPRSPARRRSIRAATRRPGALGAGRRAEAAAGSRRPLQRTLDSGLRIAGRWRQRDRSPPIHHHKESPCPCSIVPRLEASPLADLHAIASELSIDGYRRLRRAELIDAILDGRRAAEPAPAPADDGGRGARRRGQADAEPELDAGGRRGRRRPRRARRRAATSLREPVPRKSEPRSRGRGRRG